MNGTSSLLTSGLDAPPPFRRNIYRDKECKGPAKAIIALKYFLQSIKIAEFIVLMKIFSKSGPRRFASDPCHFRDFLPNPGVLHPIRAPPKKPGRLESRPWSTLSNR